MSELKPTLLAFSLLTFCFACAFFTVYMKNQTILLGYQISSLKTQEKALLQEKKHLTMTLAKMTTKDNLEKTIED